MAFVSLSRQHTARRKIGRLVFAHECAIRLQGQRATTNGWTLPAHRLRKCVLKDITIERCQRHFPLAAYSRIVNVPANASRGATRRDGNNQVFFSGWIVCETHGTGPSACETICWISLRRWQARCERDDQDERNNKQ